MNVLAILEVAIGVIFVWFLLSLLVSTVQESIASIFQWRGRGLEHAIRQLLEDPATQKKLEIALDGQSANSSFVGRFRRIFRRPQPAYATANQFAGAAPAGVAPAGSAASPLDNSFGLADGSAAAPGMAPSGPMGAPSRPAAGLGSKFYDHPLILSLGQDVRKRRPSYIPTAQFAEVVFDLIVEAGSSTSPLRKAADRAERDLEAAKEEVPHAAHKSFQALLKRVEDSSRGKALDQSVAKSIDEQATALVEKYPILEPAVLEVKSAIAFPPLLTQLGSGIEALAGSSPQLARTLDILVTRTIQNTRDADDALAKTRHNMEAWFDNSMQRLSGSYKRRVQLTAFVLGLAVAAIVNVDSIAILRTLWSDQGVRAAIAAQAEQTVQSGAQNGGQQTAQQILNQLTSLQLPVGWTFITEKATSQGQPKDTRCQEYFGSLYPGTRCIYPAGYGALNAAYKATIWQTILGMLVTAIATMQGSPFWFGVLSKIVNLRSSTPPPTQAQPAGS